MKIYESIEIMKGDIDSAALDVAKADALAKQVCDALVAKDLDLLKKLELSAPYQPQYQNYWTDDGSCPVCGGEQFSGYQYGVENHLEGCEIAALLYPDETAKQADEKRLDAEWEKDRWKVVATTIKPTPKDLNATMQASSFEPMFTREVEGRKVNLIVKRGEKFYQPYDFPRGDTLFADVPDETLVEWIDAQDWHYVYDAKGPRLEAK